MNNEKTSKLNLFSDKFSIEKTAVIDVFYERSYLQFINFILQFDLLTFLEDKLCSYFSQIVCFDEYLFLLLSRFVVELLRNFIILIRNQTNYSGYLCVSENAMVGHFTSLDFSLASFQIPDKVHEISCGNDVNSITFKLRNELNTLLNAIILMSMSSNYITATTNYNSFCKTSLHKSTFYLVQRIFTIWSFGQQMSSNNQILKSDTQLIESLFPELRNISNNSLTYPTSVWSSLIFYINNANSNGDSTVTTTCHLVSMLFANKEYNLLRRYCSLFLNAVRFSNQHITDCNFTFTTDQFWRHRLRLLYSLTSYFESLNSNRINLNEQFYNQLRKLVEEFIKFSTIVPNKFILGNYKDINIRCRPYFSWYCMNYSESLFSSLICSKYLTSSSVYSKSYELPYLFSLISESKVLEVLKFIDSKFCAKVTSCIHLRISYDILERITKWYNKITWSTSDIRINLQRVMRNYCCNIVELSLNTHYLGDCGSAITFMKKIISFEDTSSVSSFYDAYFMWQNCVRLLIMHGCNFGLLDWFCKGLLRTDIEIENAIIDIFNGLAKSTNFQRIVDAEHSINYYENLTVFMLSKNDFNEAARVTWMCCNRIDSASTLRFDILELWMLSVCFHLVFTTHSLNFIVISNPDNQSLNMDHTLLLVTLRKLGARIFEIYVHFQLILVSKRLSNSNNVVDNKLLSKFMNSTLITILNKYLNDSLSLLEKNKLFNKVECNELFTKVIFSCSLSKPYFFSNQSSINDSLNDIFCRFICFVGFNELPFQYLCNLYQCEDKYQSTYVSFLKSYNFNDRLQYPIESYFQNVILNE